MRQDAVTLERFYASELGKAAARILSGKLTVKNTTIAGSAEPLAYSKGSAVNWGLSAVQAWFNTPALNNLIYPENADLKLAAPFNYSNPDFTPQAGSPLVGAGAADFSDAKLSGFTQVNFRGAVGASGADADWWKGWTSFK